MHRVLRTRCDILYRKTGGNIVSRKVLHLTLRVTFNMIPLAVLLRVWSNESSTRDVSGNGGKWLVILSLETLDPALFLAVTWKL